MQYTKKERLIELYKDGFREDSDAYIEDFFENVYDENNVVTREENGEIVSVAHIVNKKLSFFGKVIDVPYLVAVSTITPMRGKKMIEPVIYDALKLLEERKAPFVLLYPFEHDYYKKYAFTVIDDAPEVHSLDALKSLTKVKSDNVDIFYHIYNEYAKKKDISIYRDRAAMARRLEVFNIDSDESYLLYDGGNMVGYALKYDDHVEEVILTANYILDREKLKMRENIMARLVDIPTALELLKFSSTVNERFILNVSDRFYGDKRVVVNITRGKVSACYLGEEKNSIPTIDITMEKLTELVFGRSTSDELPFFRQTKISIVDKY